MTSIRRALESRSDSPRTGTSPPTRLPEAPTLERMGALGSRTRQGFKLTVPPWSRVVSSCHQLDDTGLENQRAFTGSAGSTPEGHSYPRCLHMRIALTVLSPEESNGLAAQLLEPIEHDVEFGTPGVR